MSKDWRVVPNRNDHWGMIEVVGPAISCRGFRIAAGVDYAKAVEITSDANLIAASPDLLDALKMVVDAYGFDPSIDSAIWQTAFAAIAKATGEKA